MITTFSFTLFIFVDEFTEASIPTMAILIVLANGVHCEDVLSELIFNLSTSTALSRRQQQIYVVVIVAFFSYRKNLVKVIK